ncbi:ArnT family glycosyltransferase [Spirosoma fluviale]|uniref:Dolichyl-phosphate-mannose-protein mannosyltransferase n=1 Tax=Spirosoma fluviale TaxID=1597977 RepID=A0A286F8I7_9BACT|nr:glycosyltransferase family 39 protein [Spirosoma fluviale]SOD79503.1 Dolichyl-phosphate-mannose-protein mannosyltransferase [Spirosoma fluviale]
MYILLVLWSIGSLWFGQYLQRLRHAQSAPIRYSFIDSLLVNTLVIIFLTEIASSLRELNETVMTLAWVGVAVCCTGWAVFQYNLGEGPIRPRLSALSTVEKRLLWVVGIISCLTLLTAFVYPPNNFDSLTYHMGRIGHWLQQQSVEPFATHIERQLYQPPLAEWIIMHTMLLSHSDLWANSVQWLATAGCLVGVSLLSHQLGGSRAIQIATVFMAVTIPMVILQSSSTQNDLVVSFYLIVVALYLLRYYQEKRVGNLIWVGLALGAALLTKGTAYLYCAPLLFSWGVLELRQLWLANTGWQVRMYAVYKLGLRILLMAILSIGLNAGHYSRNLRVYGHPLTDPQTENVYVNQYHSAGMMVSNISRNLALHFGFPGVNWVAQRTVEKLHQWIHVAVSDSRTTFPGSSFRIPSLSNNEDNASSFIHFLWLTGSVIWLIRRKKIPNRTQYLLLAGLLACTFGLFCAYLRWQPWHSRLHTTLFLMASPIGAIWLVHVIEKGVRWPLALFLGSATAFVMTNPIRPLITLPPLTYPVSFLDGRAINYFVNERHLYSKFDQITTMLNQQHQDSLTVGLILNENDFDYMWYQQVRRPARFYHIRVTTSSQSLDPQPAVNYVISMQWGKDTLHYGGRVYRRLQPRGEKVVLFALQKGSGYTKKGIPAIAARPSIEAKL